MADPGDPVTEQPAKKEEGVEGAEVVETVPAAGEADADTAVAKVEKEIQDVWIWNVPKLFLKDEYFKTVPLGQMWFLPGIYLLQAFIYGQFMLAIKKV